MNLADGIAGQLDSKRRLKMKELWKWFPLVALSPLFLSACGQTVCDSDMCEIPAGTFWMGCNEEVDDDCSRNEYPYHQVFLDGFMMDRTEVTYGAFIGLVPPKWTHQLCCHGSFRKDKPFVIHGTQVPV